MRSHSYVLAVGGNGGGRRTETERPRAEKRRAASGERSRSRIADRAGEQDERRERARGADAEHRHERAPAARAGVSEQRDERHRIRRDVTGRGTWEFSWRSRAKATPGHTSGGPCDVLTRGACTTQKPIIIVIAGGGGATKAHLNDHADRALLSAVRSRCAQVLAAKRRADERRGHRPRNVRRRPAERQVRALRQWWRNANCVGGLLDVS